MRSLLLTGASGFLGGDLLEKAAARWSLTAISNKTHHPGTFPLDLTNREACLAYVRAARPEVILHAAANANLDECERHPEAALDINVTAVATLLEAAQEVHARFILVSTDMVFDGSRGLYREGDVVHPLSVYGQTKVAAERLVMEAPGSHLIARSALIYGRPRHNGSSFSQWIENRLQTGQMAPLYTDQFRSPIWVRNLADVLLELADSEITGIVHCGGSDRVDRHTFALELCRAAGYDAALLQPTSMHDTVSAAPRPVDVSLDISRASALLHTPLLDIQEGLCRMVSDG